MRAFVAYSRPRGKFGYYVFTILAYFSYPTEKTEIRVILGSTTYSCHSCGRWASIPITPPPTPAEHSVSGVLEFYRYDNVEPDHKIFLDLIDTELVYAQHQTFNVQLETVEETGMFLYKHSRGYDGVAPSGKLYEVILINWDEYMAQRPSGGLLIEEELIQKTMNAEKITIQELHLEPARQLPAIEGQQQFIEGELRYLTD
jgi:hypothetical protein